MHRSDRIANACPPALVFTLVCTDFILTFLEWLVCLKPVSPVLLKLKYHCQYLSIVIQNMEYLVISASAMYIEPQLLSFHSYQERDFFSHWNHLMLFIYKKKKHWPWYFCSSISIGVGPIPQYFCIKQSSFTEANHDIKRIDSFLFTVLYIIKEWSSFLTQSGAFE